MPNHATKTALIAAIDTMRNTRPLVQCLTNNVVTQVTANVLLAAGATPAMCDTPEESAAFASVASGVLINPGTPSAEQYAGMRQAILGANSVDTPWVLDPVAAGALPHRTAFSREILAYRPAAIRGNASEIAALAGVGAGGRGVDATDEVEATIPAARDLSAQTGGVVAISGAQDVIVSTRRVTRLVSGHPMMQLVIGTGCSLGALVAAYLGAHRTATAGQDAFDLHDAVVAAHAHSGAAGMVAAQQASAPGSFAVAWIDALYQLTSERIAELVTIEEE
ncbi:hydroxyethylthiazole kinase [Corynebacterium matruchotii]|mgnify:FL=1|jgi:hydroxyethylthiazole kinase